MSEIIPLPESDYDAFITLLGNAYPSMNTADPAGRQRLRERFLARQADPGSQIYGLYRDGLLLGGMLLLDFRMRMLSATIDAGGVGMVAVDLLHKKQKVAYDLIQFFLQHYHARGSAMALLYPFRPDFYRKMGFGAGTQISQYQILPASLPPGPAPEHVVFLSAGEKELLRGCYSRMQERTHGLIAKSDIELNGIFSSPSNRIVAYKIGEQVQGYMVFSFAPSHPSNFTINDLIVSELCYEHPAALAELLSFLRAQADQIRRIVISTQDEDFYHALPDPRNASGNMIPSVYHESSTQGVGVMYRVLDTARLFEQLGAHDFGGQDCSLQLDIRDSFFAANSRSVRLQFRRGRAEPLAQGAAEIRVGLDVTDFSALIMGSARFRSLYGYGLASISDHTAVDTIDRLFRSDAKPICTTPF